MTRVATVQMELEFQGSEKSFMEKVEPFVRKASRGGAELVVFPEDTGSCLLGLYTKPWKNMPAMFFDRNIFRDIWDRRRFRLECHAFSWVHPTAQRIFENVFSALANKHSIHIMTGSILFPDGDKVYNQAYLYGPDGALIGTQRKIQLFLTEVEWGCGTGETIEVFDTAAGRLGILICMDTGYPEMGRIMASRGVEIMLDCTANPDECYDHEDLNGLWARVQDTGIFGVKSCLYGNVLGGKMILSGKSAIYAPFELTPDRSGILARAAAPNRDELLIAEIDLGALPEIRTERAGRRNMRVIGRYIPEMYNNA